jgi:uncharacterized membrane protein required for colicin V production
MHTVGDYLADKGWIRPANAPIDGFLIIFIGLAIIQGLLYRMLTSGYKIGGLADRVGGTLLGFIEGAIFISSMLFIFALSGFPDQETKRDARFYKPIVNIAPQILDIASSLDSETTDKLKEVGSPGAIKSGNNINGLHPSVDTSAVLSKQKQLEIRNRNR